MAAPASMEGTAGDKQSMAKEQTDDNDKALDAEQSDTSNDLKKSLECYPCWWCRGAGKEWCPGQEGGCVRAQCLDYFIPVEVDDVGAAVASWYLGHVDVPESKFTDKGQTIYV